MSTKRNALAVRAAALATGVTVAGILAWILYAAGKESTAKGVIIGASAVVLAAVILWARGTRGGAAARLASGEGDERERMVMTQAAADGALVMFIAGVVGTIGALFGWSAVAVAGSILWTGLIAIAASFAIRIRRT
jgi:hypothetical protein